MTDKYILQAREILADAAEKRGAPRLAKSYRDDSGDDYVEITVLANVLRQHAEKQPTFEQWVRAMLRMGGVDEEYATDWLHRYDRHLAEIMAPKVDPLVEAWNEAWKDLSDSATKLETFRKALAARRLEVREVQS